MTRVPGHQPLGDHAGQQAPGDRAGERQDQQDPQRIGDEPGTEHQRPADEDQGAVRELRAGIRPVSSAVRSACHARPPSRLINQPPSRLSSDQQQDRPPGSDHLPDLDQHVDLDQRHHDERHEQRGP